MIRRESNIAAVTGGRVYRQTVEREALKLSPQFEYAHKRTGFEQLQRNQTNWLAKSASETKAEFVLVERVLTSLTSNNWPEDRRKQPRICQDFKSR